MMNNSTPLNLKLSSVLEWKYYILLLFMFLSKKLRPCYWLQKTHKILDLDLKSKAPQWISTFSKEETPKTDPREVGKSV